MSDESKRSRRSGAVRLLLGLSGVDEVVQASSKAGAVDAEHSASEVIEAARTAAGDRGRGVSGRSRGARGRGTVGRSGAVDFVEPVRRSSRIASRAADLQESAGARPGGVGRGARGGARIVTGFGSERVEDVDMHVQQAEADALQRAALRRDEGTRGRMTGLGGDDLDRSAGGAWRAGRR